MRNSKMQISNSALGKYLVVSLVLASIVAGVGFYSHYSTTLSSPSQHKPSSAAPSTTQSSTGLSSETVGVLAAPQVTGSATSVANHTVPVSFLSYDVLSPSLLSVYGPGSIANELVNPQTSAVSKNTEEQPVVDPNTGYAILLKTDENTASCCDAQYITVYDPSGHMVANVSSPIKYASNIFGITYDPAKNYIFVSTAVGETGPSAIAVVNGATGTEIGAINVLANTRLGLTFYNGLLYDVVTPPKGAYYGEYPSLLVINASSIGTVAIGTIKPLNSVTLAPSSVSAPPVIDPKTGDVYLIGAYNVTVTDSTLHQVSAISIGNNQGWYTSGLAYDPNTNEFFATNAGSNTVSVIDATTNTVTSTITVGHNPTSVAFDPNNGEIYVLNYGDQTISTISP